MADVESKSQTTEGPEGPFRAVGMCPSHLEQLSSSELVSSQAGSSPICSLPKVQATAHSYICCHLDHKPLKDLKPTASGLGVRQAAAAAGQDVLNIVGHVYGYEEQLLS